MSQTHLIYGTAVALALGILNLFVSYISSTGNIKHIPMVVS